MSESTSIESAVSETEILRTVAVTVWKKYKFGTCPESAIPDLRTLSLFLPDVPNSVLADANQSLSKLFDKPMQWCAVPDHCLVGLPSGKKLEAASRRVLSAPGGDTGTSNDVLSVREIHSHWRNLSRDCRPVHPLAPIVYAALHAPHNFDSAMMSSVNGMAPRLDSVAGIFRTNFEFDGSVEVTDVDGDAGYQQLSALNYSDLFPQKPERRRRVFSVNPQMNLKLPGVRGLSQDIKLTALRQLGATKCEMLKNDMWLFLSLTHASRNYLILTEHQGASLLARDNKGNFRRPRLNDYKRFWCAIEELANVRLYDIARNWRWATLATVDPDPGARQVIIGQPAWMRRARASGERWVLTAEGSKMAKSRFAMGNGSPAGRIITGLEFRLYSRFDGKPGAGPDVRPASGKTGAGRVVTLAWHEVLSLGGDAWDPSDNLQGKAALARFRRFVERAESAGYRLPGPSLRSTAEAGDSVEIVSIIRGGNGRTAGLKVRASERFVEAAKMANQPYARGFKSMSVQEWAGYDREDL